MSALPLLSFEMRPSPLAHPRTRASLTPARASHCRHMGHSLATSLCRLPVLLIDLKGPAYNEASINNLSAMTMAGGSVAADDRRRG